jgi:hypothetical protein
VTNGVASYCGLQFEEEMWMNSKCCYRFQEELSSAVMQRDPQYVTRAELIKLMEWKLTVCSN